jgi:peptide/nickel transport system permease protein
MIQYLLRRLVWAAVTILFSVTLVFFVTAALPGDPARTMLGTSATPESIKALNERMGFDRPLLVQYWDWLSSFLTGDLGPAATGQQSVWSIVGPRLVDSMILLVVVVAIAFPLAVSLGVASAARRSSLFDQVTNVFVLVVVALPEFVVAIALIFLLGGGLLTVFPAVSTTMPGESVLSQPSVLALPALTAITVTVPYMMRMVRAVMLEVLDSEYVEMARLSGLRRMPVLIRHALPNALAPFTQVAALILVYLLGGLVIVESVFGYPGIGSGLVAAVEIRDLPQVQGIAVALIIGAVLCYLAADLISLAVSPRARTELS